MPTERPQTLWKYADESHLYDFDFSLRPELVAGQTLSSPTVAAVEGDGGLTIGSPQVSGARVQVRLSAGTAGTNYMLRCQVDTSGGSTLKTYGELSILAVPET